MLCALKGSLFLRQPPTTGAEEDGGKEGEREKEGEKKARHLIHAVLGGTRHQAGRAHLKVLIAPCLVVWSGLWWEPRGLGTLIKGRRRGICLKTRQSSL